MPLFVLLSPDAHLHAELESCLGGLTPRPTLIQTSSFQELEGCLESLRDVDAVLLDAESFDPPPAFHLPLLLIGASEKVRGKSMLPQVPRPLHPESIAYAIENLLRRSPNSPEQRNSRKLSQVDFITALLREVVHDLNNQFTTLRGQLPLLMELYPREEEVLGDMNRATERATRLLHLLEGIDPDTLPDPERFPLETLHRDFLHFAAKVYPGPLQTELPPELGGIYLRGDAALLCCLLLQVAWLYSTEAPELKIHYRLREKFLEVRMQPASPVANRDSMRTRLEKLASGHHPGHVSLSLDQDSVVCALPRS